MASPVPGASIMFGYLYFVLSWGPKHMEHRKPYQLKNLLIVYNFLQVLFSAWLFWEGLDAAWLTKYSWKCEPVDYSDTPEARRVRISMTFIITHNRCKKKLLARIGIIELLFSNPFSYLSYPTQYLSIIKIVNVSRLSLAGCQRRILLFSR